MTIITKVVFEPQTVKAAASIQGIVMDIRSDFMAEPFHRFIEPERKKIEEALNALHLH